MDFPPQINAVLRSWGITPETRAALFELFVHLGQPSLEVFADIAEGAASTSAITPEDLEPIRAEVSRRYVASTHPLWVVGVPSASFWHQRDLGGRAAGLVTPLGSTREADGLCARVAELAEAALPDDQKLSRSLLVLSRNAHFGGRMDTVSFDLVAVEEEDAQKLAAAEGRQHTLPGSIGETSASWNDAERIGLIWEIQPNVLKPEGDRNRAVRRIWGRMRNWHVATLMAAVLWMQERGGEIFLLDGDALAATHEVNPDEPVSESIARMHDRTVATVVGAIGGVREPVSPSEIDRLITLELANSALSRHLETIGTGVSRVLFGN